MGLSVSLVRGPNSPVDEVRVFSFDEGESGCSTVGIPSSWWTETRVGAAFGLIVVEASLSELWSTFRNNLEGCSKEAARDRKPVSKVNIFTRETRMSTTRSRQAESL